MVQKNPGGRPQFTATPEQRRQVETLSGWGIPQANICCLIQGPNGLPISEHTLRKHFRAELDTGMVKADAAVIGNLWRHASKGTGAAAVTACIWWTKTRCGWKETVALEHSGGNEPVKHEIIDRIQSRLDRLAAARRKAEVAEGPDA